MALLDYVIENGPLMIDEDHVTPEDIAYTSSVCTLACFGTFGNILILIMFSKKELSRTSYSIYIRAAAVSDTIFMLMNISEYVMEQVTSYSSNPLIGMSYPFGIVWCATIGTFRSASPWIVVALALDRCVAIWNPLHKTRYCTKKVATIITASIVLASLGVELGLYVPSMKEGFNNSCTDSGLSVQMLMIKRLVTGTGLPCIAMLIPNLLVIFKIQQSLSFRRSFTTTNDQQERVAKSARPLLVVSCLAFITLLPISIKEVVELSKTDNGTTGFYPNNDYSNHGSAYGDYPNHGNVFDDYPIFASRNNSVKRMSDDQVLNFSNETFEILTTMRSFDGNSDLIESTSLGTGDKGHANSDLIESTSLGTSDKGHANSDLIESTSLGTSDKGHANPDLIESTGLGTGDERNANPDLIESTGLGTGDDMNWGLIESTGNEGGDGQHGKMNTNDLENQENGENQTLEKENLGNETVQEGLEYLEDEDFKKLDTDLVWAICNFIYMCNFAQNFYLLILSSLTYRNAIFMMFSCKCRKKKKRAIPHVNREIQQPAVQTISHPSRTETASTPLEAVSLDVQ